MHRILHVTLLITLAAFRLFSQSQTDCATPTDPRFLEKLRQHRSMMATHEQQEYRNMNMYPVTLHIMRLDDGTGGLDPDSATVLLHDINDLLEPAGINLFLCSDIQFIDDSDLYNYKKSMESSLLSGCCQPNTIYLYFHNPFTTPSGNPLCGYAYFPGWKDMVVVGRNCAQDGSTLVHEFGHYFGLIHTHGISNLNLTDELADYSNCAAAGDDICDTPADPKLDQNVDSTCLYTGTGSDANGQLFDPDPSNFMSYAPKPCRFQFTPGQYNRMSYV